MRKLYNATQGHTIHSETIFDDGIWGRIGLNLDSNDALAIGCTVGMMLKSKDMCLVVLGRDNRLSSPALEVEMSRGLAASGCYVIQAGIVPTPALLFSMHCMDASAVMISGGSNDASVNGFSIFMEKIPVRGEKLRRICALATNGTWKGHKGGALAGDILEVYCACLRKQIQTSRALKIAWDLGGGTACTIVPDLTNHIRGEHLLMFEQLDTTKGENSPDAFDPQRVQTVQQVVREQQCDLGIILNVDCTQLAVVDDTGKLCESDAIFLVLLKHLHALNPNLGVMVNMGTRLDVTEMLQKLGVSVGHSPQGIGGMLQQIIQQKAHFGTDGHGRYAFNNQIDTASFDAILAAFHLLNILSAETTPLAALTQGLIQQHQQQLYAFAHPSPAALISQVRSRLLKQNIRTIDTDGLRNEYSNGWWWIRPSHAIIAQNTTAVSGSGLVADISAEADLFRDSSVEITIEAKSSKAFQALVDEISGAMPEWNAEQSAIAEQERDCVTPDDPAEQRPKEALDQISEHERETIEFMSRHWRSLRTPDKKVDEKKEKGEGE